MSGTCRPLVGVGLLARAECYLRRERARQRDAALKQGHRACTRQRHIGIKDEAKLDRNCKRLAAYLSGVLKARQPVCANVLGMSHGEWCSFIAEATWRLPLWEDDKGAIGLRTQ